MFNAPRDSFLAVLGDFGPSLLTVAPFLPALILALALLAFAARPEPAAEPIQVFADMRRRRQIGRLARPEAMAAGLVLAVILSASATVRGFSA